MRTPEEVADAMLTAAGWSFPLEHPTRLAIAKLVAEDRAAVKASLLGADARERIAKWMYERNRDYVFSSSTIEWKDADENRREAYRVQADAVLRAIGCES